MPPTNLTAVPPGEVQDAIDRVHVRGGGKVILDPRELYDPNETWNIRPGVVLDCNGSIIVPATDSDVMHVHPGAFVVEPRIHLISRDWSSTVFTFDTEWGIYHPEWNLGSYRYYGAGVFGGYTRGVDVEDKPGNARLYYLHNRGEQTNAAMAWIQCVHHDSYFMETVADLHVREYPWWINGNYFSGCHWMFRTCIRTRGSGQIDGNTFEFFQTQPETYSRYLWDLQLGNYNTLKGMVWDTSLYDRVLRVSNQEPRPKYNLVRSNEIHSEELNDDVGENYIVTNRSLGQLSIVGQGSNRDGEEGEQGGGGGEGGGDGGDGGGGGASGGGSGGGGGGGNGGGSGGNGGGGGGGGGQN